MKEEIVSEVMKRLDLVAQKIGEAGGYFWPKLVYQQYTEGWLCVICGLSLLFLGLIVFITAAFNWKNIESDATPKGMYAVFGSIVGVSMLAIGAGLTLSNIMCILLHYLMIVFRYHDL